MEAFILVEHATSRVYSPYEYRAVLKAVPGRTWDPAEKCWRIPTDLVDSVARRLRARGCRVTVDESATPQKPRGWAREMFAAVGPQRAQTVYRALSRVLHPDQGGSTELQQELNRAYEGATTERNYR